MTDDAADAASHGSSASGVGLVLRTSDVSAADARAASEAAARAMRALGVDPSLHLSLVLTDDAEMAELNRTYRRKQGPTDVLSFPFDPGLAPDEARAYLGDIVIAVPTAARQARRARRGLSDELRLLAVHGLLHLLGHEDETEEGAAHMRALERSLGVRP